MKSKIISVTSNLLFVSVTSLFVLCGAEACAPQDVYSSPKVLKVFQNTELSAGLDKLDNAMRFQALAQRWKAKRGATSSIHELCTTDAYLSIMAMGRDALPLLLAQLQQEGDHPDHWLVALSHIARVDPVPAEDKGSLPKMAKAWLEWAASANDNA